MFNDICPDIFSKILNNTNEQQPNNEELQDKITLAYLTLKKKAAKRKRRQWGSTRWEPELNEEVLLKCQPTSDAAIGITAKYMRPFDGLWVITKIIPPSCHEMPKRERLEGPLIRQLWKNIWGNQQVTEYIKKKKLIGDSSRSERNISNCI